MLALAVLGVALRCEASRRAHVAATATRRPRLRPDNGEGWGAMRVCPGCGTTMKNWRRHLARCSPDALGDTWEEDAPYVWSQIKCLWGASSLTARIMAMRFGFEGTPKADVAAIASALEMKDYLVAERIQQTLQAIPMVADTGDLKVLFEDEDILAVYKPPAMAVTPRNRNRGGALLNRAVHHARSAGLSTPHVVHRLDYNTSGVVVFAKNSAAAQHLCEQFAQGSRVHKMYVALAVRADGRAKGGASMRVEAPIGRLNEFRHCVRDDGRPATTLIRVARASEAACALLIKPKTGRTHQIRVHAAHARLPLLGDEAYGVTAPCISRHALHAWKVRFAHPRTGGPVTVTAPLDLAEDLVTAAREVGLGPVSGGKV